ncbi:hypothetical protein BDF14DRAFT_1712253, partial [Spinellus fusiger]
NETVGTFVDYDETLFAPVACDEYQGDENWGVLGHTNPQLKQWPMEVGWTIDTSLQHSDLRVQGMVVV